MNAKNIGIIGLLIIVVVAFTGLASAATQQVLVSDAYDEQVLVSDAYDEQVLVSPAWNESVLVTPEWNETVFDHYLVNGEYTVKSIIHHEAVYETVHHDAVYETVVVIDEPAWNETVDPVYETVVVVDVPAVPAHNELIGTQYYSSNGAATSAGNYYVHHGCADSYEVVKISKYNYLLKLYEQHDAIPAVTHEEQQLVSEGYVIEHPAVTHEEQQLVSEAYDEQVLVSEAYDETVYTQVPYENLVFKTFDVNAWANWIYSHPGSVGGWGSWPAYYSVVNHPAVYETVEHPAVFETVHHDAVYETVHHPAVYETVEVADPVVPVVSEPAAVEPVSEPVTVPMQKTGGDLTAVGVALAAIIAGMFIPVIARRRNNDDEE